MLSTRPVSVLSIDEGRTVETEADRARNDLLDLVESQKTGRILTGTLQGVERAANSKTCTAPWDAISSTAILAATHTGLPSGWIRS